MRLRPKIVLIVTLVVVLYAAADHLVQRATLGPSFEALESAQADKDLERARLAIRSEIEHLDRRCRDWAHGDETCAFLERGDERFADANLGPAALREDELDLLLLAAADGRIAWRSERRWRSGEPFDLRELPALSRLAPEHSWLVQEDAPRDRLHPRGYASGIAVTEHGPLFFASRPVLSSAGEGPVRGTAVLGRFLDPPLLQEIGNRTRLDLALWSLQGEPLPAAEQEVLDEVTSSPRPVQRAAGESVLSVYGALEDMRRAPALLLRVDVPREISARGSVAVRYALLSTVAAGMLLLLVLLGVLQRTVLSPIARLTAHAVRIGGSDDTTARLNLARRDEIGILSRELDSMMEKLAASRAQVVEAAHAAGMSQIATGILHDVGNVLNSVNVSASLVAEKVRESKLEKLERLAHRLAQHAADLPAFLAGDPQGRHVVPYLSELARLMAVDQEVIAREVGGLRQGIEHIRGLVDSQQAHAGRTGPLEPASIAAAVEDALRISAQAAGTAPAPEVVRKLGELSPLRVDRHRLIEILVNLTKNAREALALWSSGPPRLTVELSRPSPRAVRIAVIDNGPGIAQGDLARIFNHGFTTRRGGHGFGLHASANAATEMGGSLRAESDGPGTGATFVLEVPVEELCPEPAEARS